MMRFTVKYNVGGIEKSAQLESERLPNAGDVLYVNGIGGKLTVTHCEREYSDEGHEQRVWVMAGFKAEQSPDMFKR